MVVYLSETSNVKVRLSQKRKKREPAVPVLTYGGAPKITLFQLDALGALWCLTYQECLGPFTWSRSAPPNVFNLFGVCPFRSASVLSPDRAAHLPMCLTCLVSVLSGVPRSFHLIAQRTSQLNLLRADARLAHKQNDRAEDESRSSVCICAFLWHWNAGAYRDSQMAQREITATIVATNVCVVY